MFSDHSTGTCSPCVVIHIAHLSAHATAEAALKVHRNGWEAKLCLSPLTLGCFLRTNRDGCRGPSGVGDAGVEN